jgi:hypothetical protein
VTVVSEQQTYRDPPVGNKAAACIRTSLNLATALAGSKIRIAGDSEEAARKRSLPNALAPISVDPET